MDGWWWRPPDWWWAWGGAENAEPLWIWVLIIVGNTDMSSLAGIIQIPVWYTEGPDHVSEQVHVCSILGKEGIREWVNFFATYSDGEVLKFAGGGTQGCYRSVPLTRKQQHNCLVAFHTFTINTIITWCTLSTWYSFPFDESRQQCRYNTLWPWW